MATKKLFSIFWLKATFSRSEYYFTFIQIGSGHTVLRISSVLGSEISLVETIGFQLFVVKTVEIIVSIFFHRMTKDQIIWLKWKLFNVWFLGYKAEFFLMYEFCQIVKNAASFIPWFLFQSKSTLDFYYHLNKGQFISKCPFGVKTSSKKPTKFSKNFFKRRIKGCRMGQCVRGWLRHSMIAWHCV